MDQLNYTVVLHNIRKKLGLSIHEYCVADAVYHLANNPNSNVKGWCYASKTYIAEFLGITDRGVFKIIDRLIEKQLVEKDKETKYLRTTGKWYDSVVIPKAKAEYERSSGGMNKVHRRHERSSVKPLNKVHTIIDSNKNINKEGYKKFQDMKDKLLNKSYAT